MENKKTNKVLDKILIIFIILFSILGITQKVLAGKDDHEAWTEESSEYLTGGDAGVMPPWESNGTGIIYDKGGSTKDGAERSDTGIDEVGITGSNGSLNTGEGGAWSGGALFLTDFIFSAGRNKRTT